MFKHRTRKYWDDDNDDEDDGTGITGEGGIAIKRFTTKLLNAPSERSLNACEELTPKGKGNVFQCEPINSIFFKYLKCFPIQLPNSYHFFN